MKVYQITDDYELVVAEKQPLESMEGFSETFPIGTLVLKPETVEDAMKIQEIISLNNYSNEL